MFANFFIYSCALLDREQGMVGAASPGDIEGALLLRGSEAPVLTMHLLAKWAQNFLALLHFLVDAVLLSFFTNLFHSGFTEGLVVAGGLGGALADFLPLLVALPLVMGSAHILELSGAHISLDQLALVVKLSFGY